MSVSVADLRKLTGCDVAEMGDDLMSFFGDQGQLVVDTYLDATKLSAPILSAIALNLAGHFYVLSKEAGGITYQRAGQSETRYKTFGYNAIGFVTTRFGQTAIALDETGKLRGMSSGNKVGFFVESYSPAKNVPKDDVL